MSKEIKQNCQRMIVKLQNKLEQLKVFVKMKKSQNILEKFISQIINDFKYFHDEFQALAIHNNYMEKKIDDQQTQIFNLSTELMSKNAQKRMYEHMIKIKYQKMSKKQQFLEFINKNTTKQPPRHQRHQSQLIKKGLNQLQRDILESNNRVCSRVKQLQSQIQNDQQRYLAFQNVQLQKNVIPDLELSRILPQKGIPHESAAKTLDKRVKIRNIRLNFGDDITAYKTNKKQLSSRQHQNSKQFFEDIEAKQSQTMIINKKKKQQLAELIAQQAKVIVSREKYFSTDL